MSLHRPGSTSYSIFLQDLFLLTLGAQSCHVEASARRAAAQAHRVRPRVGIALPSARADVDISRGSYTLWDLWIDTHVTAPLRRAPDGSVVDRYGTRIDFYADVPGLL